MVKHGNPHSFIDLSVSAFTAAYGQTIQVPVAKISIQNTFFFFFCNAHGKTSMAQFSQIFLLIIS